MDRRELIKMIALMSGAAMVGGEFILSGCKADTGSAKVVTLNFTDQDLMLLDEIGECIIPATDSPGAKAAQVSQVMKAVVTDCYWPDQQSAFMNGIKQIDIESDKRFGKKFMEADASQRKELLTEIAQEANVFNEKQSEIDKPKEEALKAQDKEYDFIPSPRHYFTMMKQLTLLGYFSSEVGLTKSMNYLPVPGKYDGAFKITPGTKVFSS